MDSERSNETEQILKQAKNKYYLKREHLTENKALDKGSISKTRYQLPPMNSNKKFTLVLDLDETLVHFVSKEKKFKLRPGCI